MASLGGVPLYSSGQKSRFGGAFLLTQPSKVNAAATLPNGIEVETSIQNPYVIVRMEHANASDLLDESYRAAQIGLDCLSVLGIADFSVRDAEHEHLTWHSDRDHYTIRIHATSTIAFTTIPPRVLMNGKEVEEDTGGAASGHSGFRYYRRAQITDDLYDAYRNMYLAFEVTLSRRIPKSPSESEAAWIRRGLSTLDGDSKLGSLINKSSGRSLDSLVDQIYRDARLPLFHAKHGHHHFEPQSICTQRQQVSDALTLLTEVVLRLFELWHNARRSGGFVFPNWVYRNIESQWTNAKVVVSDHLAIDRSESDLSHPRFSHGVWSDIVSLSTTGRRQPKLVATIDATQLTKFPDVRRFDIVSQTNPLMAHILETEFDVSGFSTCEFVAVARVANNSMPKTFFKM
jgi:hypothetical protein